MTTNDDLLAKLRDLPEVTGLQQVEWAYGPDTVNVRFADGEIIDTEITDAQDLWYWARHYTAAALFYDTTEATDD